MPVMPAVQRWNLNGVIMLPFILDEIRDAIASTATSLRRSMRIVGSLNGAIDSPIPEQNITLHLASHFIDRGYAVYAEPALQTSKSRIDLLCANREFTLAIEVKSFGQRRFDHILSDVNRLAGEESSGPGFHPQAAPRKDDVDKDSFWKGKPIIGMVVIQSYAGFLIEELWHLQVADSDEFKPRVHEMEEIKGAHHSDFQKLAERLQSLDGKTGSEKTVTDLWPGAADMDLLWAAFQISKE